MSLTDLKCNAWSLDIMGPSLHNEVLISTTNDFLYTSVIVQHMEKNLDITKPPCSEQVLLVLWPFVSIGAPM